MNWRYEATKNENSGFSAEENVKYSVELRKHLSSAEKEKETELIMSIGGPNRNIEGILRRLNCSRVAWDSNFMFQAEILRLLLKTFDSW